MSTRKNRGDAGADAPAPLASAQQITKRFAGRTVLTDISLDVPAGKVTVLLGPSGAGKTTLLRLLDLLEMPDAGHVRVDGVRVGAGEQAHLVIRRRFAFVSHAPVAFRRSVMENAIIGLLLRGESRNEAERLADPVLEKFGLAALRDQPARSISGGELQRLAIARALIIRPDLLLLDEPVAHLDPGTTRRVEAIIARYVREGGTALVATHDLFHARRVADAVAILIEGRLAAAGPAPQVWDDPGSESARHFLREGLPE